MADPVATAAKLLGLPLASSTSILYDPAPATAAQVRSAVVPVWLLAARPVGTAQATHVPDGLADWISVELAKIWLMPISKTNAVVIIVFIILD